jgi:hypothetical protein
MSGAELQRAAEQARAAVRAAVAAIPPEALREVVDQEDDASPCQEPPKEGPDGTTQWFVSRRAFLRPGTDMDALLDRMLAAYPAGEGWRHEQQQVNETETRAAVARGDITVQLVVGRMAGNLQTVVDATTRCFRNGA